MDLGQARSLPLLFKDAMRPSASLRTPRLLLVPLTLSQLKFCLTNLPTLEAELGMPVASEFITERVRRAIQMKIDKMTVLEESLYPWQTYWLVVISAEKIGVGLAGFKGVPNESGATEIGYGIDPSYQNRGYMSEAVKSLVEWALGHPSCNKVTATTVENPASRRLLEKLGARLVSKDDTSTSWEFRK